MDIPTLSINMASAKLMQNVNISMMKKSIEQMEQTGEQLTEMMKTAVGCTIDIKV